MTYSALQRHIAIFLTAIATALLVALLTTSSAYAESEISASSEVLPVEECDGVPMPGLWISGEALHDLHQAYQMERAKRERLESAIDLMEQVDRVYEAAAIIQESGGGHWVSYVVWGAGMFGAGLIVGLSL